MEKAGIGGKQGWRLSFLTRHGSDWSSLTTNRIDGSVHYEVQKLWIQMKSWLV
jgi:hypothetical protein